MRASLPLLSPASSQRVSAVGVLFSPGLYLLAEGKDERRLKDALLFHTKKMTVKDNLRALSAVANSWIKEGSVQEREI